MAEVEAQLEANGLPTQFESSANQPEVSHATANVAATISNAEASQLKQDAPDLDVATITKPVQAAESISALKSESVPSGTEVSLHNVNEPALPPPSDAQVRVNGHAPGSAETIDGLPKSTDTSFADSGLPASTQSDLQPSSATENKPLLTEPIERSAPMPEQAPESDLRTAPHADALSSEAVATVEAQKHEMDNKADAMEDTTNVTSQLPSQPEDTIPAQKSPPPAPVPAPAELPAQPQAGSIAPPAETTESVVPEEQPADPVPSPAVAVPAAQEDQEMTDAPAQPVKQTHEREEDNADEPAAKRIRTDEDRPLSEQRSFKMPESPAPAAASSDPPTQDNAEDGVTAVRLQHMKKVISNLKKSNASSAFRVPVDWVTMKLPTYPEVVKNPMDLGTIDNNLKNNQYTSVQAFKDDFHQIIANCVAFNGMDHPVTQSARKMETSFNNQMVQLPPATIAEQTKSEKKAAKPKLDPVRAPPPRRQSVTGKAASPKAPSPATFAPDPNGMPLIRRDSTIDGRPKRAIVPPKRNSDFGGARPKKKKYELELRFSDEVLKTISSSKHWAANQYFTHPVDPVALNIPTYFQVIKKPMDLSTVRQKLDNGLYEKAKDFEEDVRLIFKNCYKFNPEGDYVYSRGQELERLFNQEWTKKQDWITAREPDSEPASVGGDDDEDEESDEEAESDDEEEDQVSKLQAQIELIQSQMASLKNKKKSPGAPSKKADKKRKDKKQAPVTKFPGLQPKDKAKKPAKKGKPEKDRYVTFAEKQYISNGIAMLPERPMQEALKIIQNSVPTLAGSEQGEIELDIEEVPNHALLKLLAFVKKYAGPPPDEPKEQEYAPKEVSKKKNKSMSKHEQEAQIAELKGTLHHYEAGSSDAVQSIETGAEASDDDESNEESEEE
ncbi:transcription initiation at TATA-containing promoter protein [Knufia fluminis]|uniref:Transcription initiation at TATA-containing promoter protein n=1 Tax=Knufia fluminis TaxID=191047 RepID=A0AAN8F266_9EURO|nr:transcription initiation at TATA-containing promoter protein [Knufia fluminis]